MEWIDGPLKKLFTSVVLKALAANLHLEPNDLLVIGYGRKEDCVSILYLFKLLIMKVIGFKFVAKLDGKSEITFAC